MNNSSNKRREERYVEVFLRDQARNGLIINENRSYPTRIKILNAMAHSLTWFMFPTKRQVLYYFRRED